MPQFRRFLLAEILVHWTMLTQTETEPCVEDREKLIQLLQARYEFVRKRAELELDLFLAEFHDRLRRAA